MPSATSAPPGSETRQPAARRRPTLAADLVFDGIYGGLIGASTIALFFLIVDVMNGRALSSPSVMGAALFEGVIVPSIEPPRLDLVAYYSVVHLATFFVLSATLGFASRRSALIGKHSLVIVALVFSVLTATILIADALFMHGAVAALGYGPVLMANATTGVSMAVFIKWAHRPRRYGGEVTT
jgi:hypothetical protein